jgi:hypothetical protein
MCNVTTLASCLTYLGVSNPDQNRQFEDYLDSRIGERRYWWDDLSNLAKSFGVGSSGTKKLDGFASTNLDFFKNFVRDNWETALNQGKTVMTGVYTTSPGHIIKVVDVDWNRGGLIIDDPFGRAQDTAGSDYKRNNYVRSGIPDTRNTTSRGNINTQNGQNESGNGNDNFWSWSYCAEIFGDTWYLTLG